MDLLKVALVLAVDLVAFVEADGSVILVFEVLRGAVVKVVRVGLRGIVVVEVIVWRDKKIKRLRLCYKE